MKLNIVDAFICMVLLLKEFSIVKICLGVPSIDTS